MRQHISTAIWQSHSIISVELKWMTVITKRLTGRPGGPGGPRGPEDPLIPCDKMR